MNLTILNPSQSRRLAITILTVVVIAPVAIIGSLTWLAHRHYDTAINERLDRVERYNRIAATRAEVSKQLDAMKARDTRRYFLRTGAAALSAAEVQEAVRALVEGGGARLITMQAPSSKEEGRYRNLTVNVQLTANSVALRRILNAIETNTPYLFIDTLLIRSQVPGNFKPSPGAEPEMFVQFDMHGYALTGS